MNPRRTTRTHFSGYAGVTPEPAAGTACRPDGEYGRTLYATREQAYVTCQACLAALGGKSK